jgi:glucose 1-dehydrogenase
MSNRFHTYTVLVTGAGSGIGFGICRQFAQQGATVALNDVHPKLAEEAAARINAEVGAERVYPYSGNVANVTQIREIIADFSGRFNGLDVVVANAGITNYGEFLTYSPESFDTLTSVNLRGTYFTAQAGALAMIERNKAGRIILMSSGTGILAHRNLSAYGMTKAAIQMMAKSLALELGQYGITVNALAPGATITERTLTDDPEYDTNWITVTPTGRTGVVDDVAAVALFLASPEARHVSGETIAIDGGWTTYSSLPKNHPQIGNSE